MQHALARLKKNVAPAHSDAPMREKRTWPTLVALCWLSFGSPLSAQVAVLSAEGTPPRPGFVPSLRIHLPANTPVIDGGTLRPGTSSERIEQALGAAELHAALAAVWVEGPVARRDGTGELVLYVVGRKEGRAIVDVLRVPTGDANQLDDGVDRSLALKVSQVLSDLMHGGDVIDATPEDGDTFDSGTGTSREDTWRGTAQVGVLLRTPSGTVEMQPGLRVAAGVQCPSRMLGLGALDLLLRIHLSPRVRDTNDAGEIELSELAPAVEAAWSIAVGSVSLGASLGVQLRAITLSGQTALGAQGDDSTWILSLNAGPMARIALHRNLAITLGADLESSLQRRRYTINDTLTGDTGRLRAGFHASVMLAVP